jgi:hypothetical protein
MVPVDRVNAIAARTQATDYGVGNSREARQPRTTVFRHATIKMIDGENITVVIKNISATGLRVELPQERQLGNLVLVTERSETLRSWAEVVWQDAGAGGLHFR